MLKVSVSAVAFHLGPDRMATNVTDFSCPFGMPWITCN